MRRVVVVVVLAVIALVGCGDDGSEQAADSTSSTSSSTGSTESTTTERDPTVTMAQDCTRGTIPEGTPVPPGCDRLYSPFLGPGRDCTEGQHPDCIDPDRDSRFTYVFDGGRCLVERKDYDRCRDDDGDGVLDEPLTG